MTPSEILHNLMPTCFLTIGSDKSINWPVWKHETRDYFIFYYNTDRDPDGWRIGHRDFLANGSLAFASMCVLYELNVQTVTK